MLNAFTEFAFFGNNPLSLTFDDPWKNAMHRNSILVCKNCQFTEGCHPFPSKQRRVKLRYEVVLKLSSEVKVKVVK